MTPVAGVGVPKTTLSFSNSVEDSKISLKAVAGLGVPETTLWFSNSIEDSKNSLKAVIFMVMVYYSEGWKLKSAKGELHGVESERVTNEEFPGILSVESWTTLTFLAAMCDNTH